MHKFSNEIDITDIINDLDVDLSKLDCIEAFYYLILSLELLSYNTAKDGFLEQNRKIRFLNLFPKQILGKNGRLLAILPGLNGDPQTMEDKHLRPYIEQYCVEGYAYYGILWKHQLTKIKDSKVNLNVEIDKIVNSSYFIGENRREAIKKGLNAGFDGDYITAMSILAPQVEGAIRDLAQLCGDAVIKINDDGTEELLSLDSLLKLPQLNECVIDYLLFNLKLVFSSDFGFNIRNNIAHGIFEDADFDTFACIFGWWFVLRLCVEFSPLKSYYSSLIINKIKEE